MHKTIYRRRRRNGAALFLLLTAWISAPAGADEPFAGRAEITSADLIAAVLERNPTLPAMQAAWEAAQARIEPASSLDDPRLTYAVAPRTADVPGLDRGQRIELSQRLPWPGKLRLTGERAGHEAQAARENIDTARLKLTAAARAVYADWFYVHDALRINAINQDLWREFKRIAETKYATGRASKQDALRADVELNMLRHQAIVLERQRRDVLARLNTLLNRPPDLPVPSPAVPSDPRALPAPSALRAAALAHRPDLKALEAGLAAQRARTELAEREFYPDFNVMAGYNTLWDMDEKRFTVGVGINLPLDRSRRRAALGEAQANARRVEWELADRRAEIEGEVQRAFDAVEEARHVFALYREKLVPLAEENLDAARADYQAGSGDFLNLVTAEKNLVETQLGAARALADYHRHLALLALRVGGDDPLVATPHLKEPQS